MHQITALLLALMFLTFTGCEDKKPDQNAMPVENTTTIIIEKKQEKEIPEVKQVEKETTVIVDIPEENRSDMFQLLDMQKETITVTVKEKEKEMILQNNTKPIVLLQFFATWCNPCVGEIAYLNDLQEADQKDLFVAGVLTRDTIDTSSLNAFIEKNHISYTILQSESGDALAKHVAQNLDIQGTFPIPLIVIYLNGAYYTHYEGSIPVEMVKHDIKQAKQQLQKN